MAPHLTHVGVHDHGFNNVSTYGDLWRLAREGRIDRRPTGKMHFYELALEGQRRGAGAALDAAARRRVHLFVQRRPFAVRRYDPIAARARARAPARPPPRRRSRTHRSTCSIGWFSTRAPRRDTTSTTAAAATATTSAAASRTRACSTRPTAPIADPNSQQGYSPFTHVDARPGLGDARLCRAARVHPGAAPTTALEPVGGRAAIEAMMLDAARATCDFYIDPVAAADGIPYWDTGAPGLAAMADWGDEPADPFNDHEPVDSSAAAIAAQGLLRLGARAQPRREACRTAAATNRPASACSTRCSTSADRISARTRRIRACSCTRCITGRTAWDLRSAGRAHAARRVQPVGRLSRSRGGTATCNASPTASRTTTFFGPADRGQPAEPRRREPALMRLATTALVTGGTRGIGLGIARALASEGWDLALCGVRGDAEVSPIVSELNDLGAAVEYAQADVAQPRRSRAARGGGAAALRRGARAREQRRARAARARPISSRRRKRASRSCCAINLQGPYFLTQAIARRWSAAQAPIRRFRPSIVFVTSVSAEMASIDARRVLRQQGRPAMTARLFARGSPRTRHPGLRSPAGHHRHRHDGRRPRACTTAHCRRPRAGAALGTAG